MSEPAKIKWEIAGEEVGNCNCQLGLSLPSDKLRFELRNTYAQLNAFDWSN